MIYILLTIIFSSSIALILKQNDSQKGSPIVLFSANYLVAAIINFGLIFLGDGWHLSFGTFIFGAALALLFFITFIAFSKAVSFAGTALATISSRMSVIVPISLSIIIFNETPQVHSFMGIILTLLTLFLFYLSIRSGELKIAKTKGYKYLLILLFGIGLNDFALKIFQTKMPPIEAQTFIFIIFTSAFLYTLIFIFIKKIKIEKSSVILGSILGIPNGLSTVTLLGALTQIPAMLVFPIVNVGIVLLTTVAAYLIWKEKLNTYGKLALFSGMFAILLLSIQ